MGRVYKGETEAKTYSLFKDDITILRSSGTTAKHIFRLGILALQNNPQITYRMQELERQNADLVAKLQRTLKRLYDLENPP